MPGSGFRVFTPVWGVVAHDIVRDKPREGIRPHRSGPGRSPRRWAFTSRAQTRRAGPSSDSCSCFPPVLFGVRTARSRLPTWAGRTAVAVGALMAAFAAFLIHSIKIEAPLFAQARACRRSARGRAGAATGGSCRSARGRWLARPSWSRTCQESRSRSASAAATGIWVG